MNLLNIKTEESTTLYDDLVAFKDSLDDFEEYEAQLESLANLQKVKEHIFNFGVTKELLDLHGDSLKEIEIDCTTRKQIALENIEDIEIANEALVLENSFLSKILVVSKQFEKSMEKFNGRFTRNLSDIGKYGLKEYANKTMAILPAKEFIEQIRVVTRVLEKMFAISPEKGIQADLTPFLKDLEKTGLRVNTERGKIKIPKKRNADIVLMDSGWTKSNIIVALKSCIALTGVGVQIRNYLKKVEMLSKEDRRDKKEDKFSIKNNVKKRTEYGSIIRHASGRGIVLMKKLAILVNSIENI